MRKSFWPKTLFSCFMAAALILSLSPHARAERLARIRAFGDPQTLDWNQASSWIESLVIRNMMEGMLSVDSRLHLKPGLAKSWSSSADHRQYTFVLRDDARWSDGKKLVAADFVASWRRLLAPRTKSKYAWLLFDIAGAEKFHRGELRDFSRVGIKTKGESTLVVSLRAPIAYWDWIPTFFATFPVREDLIEKYGGHWTDPGKLVTCGAFVPAESEAGHWLKLVRNPYYQGERGNLDALQFYSIADDAEALTSYLEGKLDLVMKIPSLQRKLLSRSRGREFHSWPDLRTIHLRMNTAAGPTANVHFRRALALGLDRSRLSRLFDGGYQPATSFVPPGILGHLAHGKEDVELDLKLAREELRASGVNPASMKPLDLLTIGFTDQVITAQFIQDELKRNLGVPVRIHSVEPKRYYSPELKPEDFALQINFWGADFPDPDNFYSTFLSNSGVNTYHWKNPSYDALVTAARSIGDRDARARAYARIQRLLQVEEVATVPLYYGAMQGLARPGLSHFEQGAMDWSIFKGLNLE